jgi:8-oxo-dGTP pyrophosphatase MutT (NUDIX family)
VETRTRAVARVVCLDAARRVLLLRWRDPVDGNELWEPPGGGIEPGETPLDAARRELYEETRLDPAAVLPRGIVGQRDVRWKGARFVGPEHFFLARFDGDRPEPRRDGLLEDEQRDLLGYAWLPQPDLTTLAGLHPPRLLDVVTELTTVR